MPSKEDNRNISDVYYYLKSKRNTPPAAVKKKNIPWVEIKAERDVIICFRHLNPLKPSVQDVYLTEEALISMTSANFLTLRTLTWRPCVLYLLPLYLPPESFLTISFVLC